MAAFRLMILVACVKCIYSRRIQQQRHVTARSSPNGNEYPLVRAKYGEGVSYPVEGGGPKRTWPKDTKDDGKPCDKAKKVVTPPIAPADTCTIATIRYRFQDIMLPEEGAQALEEAMNVVNKEMSGCVQFKHYSAKDGKKDKRDYGLEYDHFAVKYMKTGACANPAGKSEKRNVLKVSTRCFYRGVLLHELGHLLGLKHSQSRWDSSEWMSWQKSNTETSKLKQFTKKQETMGWDNYRGSKNELWPNFTLPYDGQSIEQYPMYHFTKNGKATLVPTGKLENYWNKLSQDAGVPKGMNPHTGDQWSAGQLDYYSGNDLKMLRRMYNCRAPPEQTYSWKPLAWDVVRKKPLALRGTDGWSPCSAPCSGGIQRRVIVCVGDTDGKTYEDDRCKGHTPEVRRACNMDVCPAGKDQPEWQDARGKGCSDYDSEKCKMWGFLGASSYCLKTCPRGNPIKGGTPQKTSPKWTKYRGSMATCRVGGCGASGVSKENFMIYTWQGDQKNRNPMVMTLQKCQEICARNRACAAISIVFESIGPVAGTEKGDEKLTHCKHFKQCDRYEYLGLRFHTYWYHRGGETYYKGGEYGAINQPATPNVAAFMCPEETDRELEEVLESEEADKPIPVPARPKPVPYQPPARPKPVPVPARPKPQFPTGGEAGEKRITLMPGQSLKVDTGDETLVVTRMRKP